VDVNVSALDGPVFSRILRSGALAVFRGQEALDRINVFPVRDADTGANLTATFKAAAARLGSAAPEDVGAAAQAAADGALDGARGNSGAIVAQFLHGLAEGMKGRHDVDGPQFAAATHVGMESAYAALADPREGTILSVVKAWSRELMRRAHEEDLTRMMVGGLEAARRALAETPRQLEVLARNRVVDAGGQGFVYFLEGIHEALHGGEVAWEPAEAASHGLPALAAGHETGSAYRFCTEALIAPRDGSSLAPDLVAAAVADLGDSLVVAGGRRRLRVHLHTNEPQRLFAAVGALGVIERSKVDDMVLQQLGGRTSTIAIVTDSTTDLPEDEAFRLGVVSVPLTLSLGGRDYLDGVDITPDEFIRRVTSGSDVPHSSQPPAADFAQVYRRLLEYREGVVSVHLSGAMSGTVQAARQAASEVDPERIRVIDACAVSVGTGLLVEAIGEAIAAGAGLDEIVALAERVKAETRTFGTVESLDFAVRGGRVNPHLARTLAALHLAPIIVFDETGRALKGGVALGFDRALSALVKRTVRFTAGAPARAMVVHTGERAGADFVAARLREHLGGAVPVVLAGAVPTAHAGIGSVTVSVRRLPTT
jgi:DegV family protein with EDD domain